MLIKAFQLMNPSPSERKATKLKKTVTQHCKMNLKSSNKHFRYEKKKVLKQKYENQEQKYEN